MSKEVFKYICPTNRDGKDGTTGCFREACALCNCAPFHKMELEPGKVLTEEPKDLTCPFTGAVLELKDSWIEAPPQTMIMGFAMNKEQIRADRKQRSHAHFREEVFPTLGRDEQRHHVKKDPTLKPTMDISIEKQQRDAKKNIRPKKK
jgi:hypothetical protein